MNKNGEFIYLIALYGYLYRKEGRKNGIIWGEIRTRQKNFYFLGAKKMYKIEHAAEKDLLARIRSFNRWTKVREREVITKRKKTLANVSRHMVILIQMNNKFFDLSSFSQYSF